MYLLNPSIGSELVFGPISYLQGFVSHSNIVATSTSSSIEREVVPKHLLSLAGASISKKERLYGGQNQLVPLKSLCGNEFPNLTTNNIRQEIQ